MSKLSIEEIEEQGYVRFEDWDSYTAVHDWYDDIYTKPEMCFFDVLNNWDRSEWLTKEDRYFEMFGEYRMRPMVLEPAKYDIPADSLEDFIADHIQDSSKYIATKPCGKECIDEGEPYTRTPAGLKMLAECKSAIETALAGAGIMALRPLNAFIHPPFMAVSMSYDDAPEFTEADYRRSCEWLNWHHPDHVEHRQYLERAGA